MVFIYLLGSIHKKTFSIELVRFLELNNKIKTLTVEGLTNSNFFRDVLFITTSKSKKFCGHIPPPVQRLNVSKYFCYLLIKVRSRLY